MMCSKRKEKRVLLSLVAVSLAVPVAVPVAVGELCRVADQDGDLEKGIENLLSHGTITRHRWA